MKQTVLMLKTLSGVDEGQVYPTTYQDGEEYAIGEELLACFVELGGVELTGVTPRDLAEGELLEAGESPADARETKVTGPEETKPAAPASKKKR